MGPLPVAAGVVLLTPVNWGIESIKWAELMPWGRWSSRCRQVLYGTAWSLIGPLRLGCRGAGLRRKPTTARAGRASLCHSERLPVVVHGDRGWDCIGRGRLGMERTGRFPPYPPSYSACISDGRLPSGSGFATPGGPAAGGWPGASPRFGGDGAQPEHPPLSGDACPVRATSAPLVTWPMWTWPTHCSPNSSVALAWG